MVSDSQQVYSTGGQGLSQGSTGTGVRLGAGGWSTGHSRDHSALKKGRLLLLPSPTAARGIEGTAPLNVKEAIVQKSPESHAEPGTLGFWPLRLDRSPLLATISRQLGKPASASQGCPGPHGGYFKMKAEHPPRTHRPQWAVSDLLLS